MRMSYSPAAHFFLFLVQWSDCRLAGALGLLRILIYKVSYCDSCNDHCMNGIQCSVLLLLDAHHPRLFRPVGDGIMIYRCMLMAPPLCLPTREKLALGNSMVSSMVWYWLQFLPVRLVVDGGILYPAVIYPSLLQLQSGVTDSEDERQKAVWMERYRRRDEEKHEHCSEVNLQGEEECGICMEMRSKVLLPNCNHEMCLKCYREWYSLSLFLSLTCI